MNNMETIMIPRIFYSSQMLFATGPFLLSRVAAKAKKVLDLECRINVASKMSLSLSLPSVCVLLVVWSSQLFV